MLNQFIWGLQAELARSVSLQYPKSIAQAVSLAETTELAVKASRRPATKTGSSGNATKRPKYNQIGAEDFGVVEWDVGEGKVVEGIWGIRVDVVVEQVDEEEEEVEVPVLIRWRVTGVGCMAIWPVTVPAPGHNR